MTFLLKIQCSFDIFAESTMKLWDSCWKFNEVMTFLLKVQWSYDILAESTMTFLQKVQWSYEILAELPMKLWHYWWQSRSIMTLLVKIQSNFDILSESPDQLWHYWWRSKAIMTFFLKVQINYDILSKSPDQLWHSFWKSRSIMTFFLIINPHIMCIFCWDTSKTNNKIWKCTNKTRLYWLKKQTNNLLKAYIGTTENYNCYIMSKYSSQSTKHSVNIDNFQLKKNNNNSNMIKIVKRLEEFKPKQILVKSYYKKQKLSLYMYTSTTQNT